MNSKRERVIVGLSGGLDSSTALFLLKEKGFQPIGVIAVIGIRVLTISIVIIILFLIDILQPRFFIQRF